MRKYLFFCLLINLYILAGCSLYTPISDEEEIIVSLPVWPPDDPFSKNYPQLSRWKISVVGADFQESFYTSQTSTKIRTKKNRPFCLLAQPLTLLENKKECAYFKPAGFLYPWNSTATNEATWERGFLADIMARFFCDAKENCMESGDTAWLASTFNWKKAQETIDKKIAESKENSDNPEEAVSIFYNPWLIPGSPILENISVSQFKASLLNLPGCHTITIENLHKLQDLGRAHETPLLSSFIPENSCLMQKNQFTVRKDSQLLVSSAKKHGILITFHSSKNISLAFIFLPIYIEDI